MVSVKGFNPTVMASLEGISGVRTQGPSDSTRTGRELTVGHSNGFLGHHRSRFSESGLDFGKAEIVGLAGSGSVSDSKTLGLRGQPMREPQELGSGVVAVDTPPILHLNRMEISFGSPRCPMT